MNTKQLRQKILDLAIRGKLVPQDPNDEPASVLLERVRAEKEKLIKEGKIKRNKKDSTVFKSDDKSHYEKLVDGTIKCIDDEIPFELPGGWEWVRLDSIAFYKKGPFGSSITKPMFIPDSDTAIKVYEQKNAIKKDDTLGSYFISPEKFEELKGFEVFPNDIIVSCAGTIGETFIMPATIRRGVINQALMRVMLYNTEMTDFYLLYFDYMLKNSAQNDSKGTAIKNIPPFEILKQYLMPIPPLNEQKRIMNLLNDYEVQLKNIENSEADISTFVIAAKQKILSLAIRGKLVSQEPDDEPASVLLDRIRTEREALIKAGKIKRGKSESAVIKSDDNSYYGNLPNGWTLAKLEDVSNIIMGQSPPGDSVNDNTDGIEFHQGKIFFSEKYLSYSKQYTCESNKIIDKNSVLLCIRAPVGIVNIVDREIAIGRGLCALTPLGDISVEFVFHWLTAFQYSFVEQATGTTFVAITTEVVRQQIIPLPPLSEQKRIVKSLENGFEILDEIITNLD